MEEMVAAAHPLEDLTLVHDVQPRNEAQGELSLLTEAETEKVILEYLIGTKGNKAKNS